MTSKPKSFRKRGDVSGEEKDAPDSGKPAESLKQKQKAKQQQLLSFADEDEEESGTRKPSAKKKYDSSKGRPPRPLLSFEGGEGDGDGGVNVQKKSYGSSHGSAHKMGFSREKAQPISSVYNQAGEYTPEKLQELQRNTIRVGGVKPQPLPPAENKNDEPVIILKGTIKPVSVVEDEKIDLPAEVLEDEMEYDESRHVAGGFPDAAAIAAAKAQRERKRIAQAAPDYIPLGTTEFRSRNRESSEEVLKSKKEEALSSDDEAEVRGRLTFIGGKPVNGSGVFQFSESVEEEDEEKLWEEEQLKKGVGKRVEDARVGVPALPGVFSQPAPGLVVETLTVDQQAELVMDSLLKGLKRLQDSHAKTKSELHAVELNMNSSEASIKQMDENLSSAKKKYEYLQRLKVYISSLCDFLQDKSPLIEQLEEHMLKLHEDRASAVFQRRFLDLSDEKAEVEAAVAAASGRSGVTQAIAAVSSIDPAPQLDEFGRDINLQKRQEKKMRAEARSRRRARRDPEAEVSSDESESEEQAFKSGWDDTLETAEKIFSDASEEFSQLEMVKNKLKAWNRDYPAAYRDAFVKLSAPAIFAPFVRLELLKWDPLHASTGFQEMNWYSLLADYDDHPELIPSLIERIAVPFLSHNLEHCWDRLSRKGTMNAVAAVMEVLAYLPASSQALQELMTLVKLQLLRAVSETEVPTWSSQVLTAVPQAAEVSANRFGCSIKLLRNIGLWHNILPRSVLDQVGLDELLYARILPHLRVLPPSEAIPKAARVVEALQGAWIGAEANDLNPRLGGFIQHLAGLGRALQTKRDAPEVPDLVNGLRKILIELRESERAAELAALFQLK